MLYEVITYDHIHSLFDGQRKGIPILSILGVLNEGYEGGEFVFFQDYEVPLKAGDIMVFPSNFMYPHTVKELTKGERFTFVTDNIISSSSQGYLMYIYDFDQTASIDNRNNFV